MFFLRRNKQGIGNKAKRNHDDYRLALLSRMAIGFYFSWQITTIEFSAFSREEKPLKSIVL